MGHAIGALTGAREIGAATGATVGAPASPLAPCDADVKAALVALLAGVDPSAVRARLLAGSVRETAR